MNFLELVQALHRESGSGGPQPTAVTGQTGESLRLVQWIRRADRAIRALHTDWDFLWAQTSFNTLANGTQIYAYPAGVGTPDEDSFLLDNEYELECLDYLEVRGEPVEDDAGRPYRVIMLPNRTFRVEGAPNAVHTISFDYWQAPGQMDLENTAESVIPEDYRDVIVGKALIQYGTYEAAPDAIQSGQQMYLDWIEKLESDYLPGDRDMHKQAEGNLFEVHVE